MSCHAVASRNSTHSLRLPEAMATIQEKIVNALREAGRPLKALDIGRAIGFSKKEVNQVIREIREVERANPGENPPLWRLFTDTASSTTPQTPSGGSGASGHSSDAALSSQLAGITIGDGNTATWNGKQIATMEKTEQGALVIQPITKDDIISRQGTQPVQETGTPGEGEAETKTTQKVDPINLCGGHKQKDEFEKGACEDNPSSKEKEETYSTQVLEAVNNGASPSPSASKAAKKKPKLAANFGAVQSSLNEKQEILDILKKEGRAMETVELSRRLGHATRREAMRLLLELEKDGKVNSVEKDEIFLWSIREGN